MDSAVILIFVFIGLFCLIALFFASRYKRCPPDKAMVIYGITGIVDNENNHQVKVLAGGAEFIWPVIQDYEYLDLNSFHQEIKEDFLSKDSVIVPTEFSIEYGIATDENILLNAAERLLGKDRKQVQEISNDIILGAIKKVFSKNDLVNIATNKDKIIQDFADEINQTLNQIGIILIRINVSYSKEKDDYLNELEQKFKESKLSNFDIVNQKEVQQQLEVLNQKIDTNAKERLTLVQEKLDLLAKLKIKS